MVRVHLKEMTWENGSLFVAAVLIISSCETQGLMYRLAMDTVTNDNTMLGDVNMGLHGNPTLVDGVRGKAISFNGENQYAEIGAQPCLTELKCTGYSFAMWLNIPQSTLNASNNTLKAVFSSGGHGKNNVEYGGVALLIHQHKIKFHFKLREDTKKWKPVSGKISQGNKWIHVVGTWALNGDVHVYIDGALNATGVERTYNPPMGTDLPSTMHIGKFNDNDDGNDNYGQFILDEWYFWDWELNGDQVAKVYEVYQTELGIFSLAMDGNLTTCLETSALNPKRKNMMLGEMTLIKDINDARSNVNITYGTDVNCNDINIVHYRKMAPECSFLKAAALQTGSDQSGTTCHYVVQ